MTLESPVISRIFCTLDQANLMIYLDSITKYLCRSPLSDYLKPIAEEEKKVEAAEKMAREEQERIYKQLSEGNKDTHSLHRPIPQRLSIMCVMIMRHHKMFCLHFPLLSLFSAANSETILKWCICGPVSVCFKPNKTYFSCNHQSVLLLLVFFFVCVLSLY